jgi:hypothetical protein
MKDKIVFESIGPWITQINKYIPYLVGDYEYFTNQPGLAHYRTLAYLSTLFNNEKIVEIGTRFGSSAMCLSYNPNNQVISYDLIDYINGKINFPNLEFRLENILTEEKMTEHLLNASLIFLDVDPHDGIQEEIVSNFLIKNGYEGFMICDDIVCERFPGLLKWWNSIPVKKVDLTKFGGTHGLGIVDFADRLEIK